MASLSTHMRRSEDHGRLPFHPECPICRDERLAGTLTSEGAMTRRAQAVVLTGVLAASAVGPSVAVAQEPDQFVEGNTAPGQMHGDHALEPGFDPGGESADLPFDATDGLDTVAAPDSSDVGTDPLAQEQAAAIEAPVADVGDEPQPAVPPPPAPDTTPTAAPAQPEAAAPLPAVTPSEPPSPQGGPRAESAHERSTESRRADRRSASSRAAERPTATTVLPAAGSEQPRAAAEVVQTPPAAPVESREHGARRGDRAHVVLAGESLWSIARDLLGPGASRAAIAREVNRLWELNKTRIATGDPDLLKVGTRLILR